MPVITAPNSITGRSIGRVMWRKHPHPLAPSTSRGLVELLGDGLQARQEDHEQGAEVPPGGHHDEAGQRQRRGVEPGRTIDADPAEQRVEHAAVVTVEVLPDHQDGHDAGDHRAGSSRRGRTYEPVTRFSHDRERSHRHLSGTPRRVQQRVQGDLAEERVLDELHEVVEPDELTSNGVRMSTRRGR